MLDRILCETAMVNRDPAYDGRFFVGVRTTGIYCRPVCRVRQPFLRNVDFYPTAAAAEAAGLRPCLRCRPETAPFCPAWQGTRSTTARALRLIEKGALDGGTVPALAERLGVGPRHLARLFADHVGASPLQVARTLRVQRAKRLLHRGGISLKQIAAEAGFGSVRSMNAAFQQLYARPPSAFQPTAPQFTVTPNTPETRSRAKEKTKS
ncbi:MAG: Ada metal-binding domain-containing protein [Pseudomonadota bacterium]